MPILHGQDDTNVPIGQAIYFQRALSQFGVEHEFVVYPREGHPILERNHQIDLLQRTRAWFARWLGPAPAKPAAASGGRPDDAAKDTMDQGRRTVITRRE